MFKITMTGNLGSDVEERHTTNEKTFYNCRVAVRGRSKRNADGTWEDGPTTWVRVNTDYLSDYMKKNLVKGVKVLVIGRLELGTYTTKEGEVRSSTDVWADDIEILSPTGTRRDNNDAGYEGDEPVAVPARRANGAGASGKMSEVATDLADLPFGLPRHIQEPWLYWRAP